MAKVITFSTNSNNQFTIITIFKTKLLSNIAITRSIVSSFTYFQTPQLPPPLPHAPSAHSAPVPESHS